jgi:sugar phosphate isomerase/epimerase
MIGGGNVSRIGLEYMTLLGAHPLHFIETAAGAGCAYVGMPAQNSPSAPSGSPAFSFVEDSRLRRDTVSCLNDYGVEIGLLDGFVVGPASSVERHRPGFEILAELEVSRVNTVSRDCWSRTVDETAALVAMAAEYDITVTVESCPALTIKTVAQALELIEIVAMPNFKLLIDTMHVGRSGEASVLATIDPMLIDYIHLCDAPMAMATTPEEYLDEARHGRLIPGEGEIPLVEMMRHVRPDVIVSVEVPLRGPSSAGMSDLARSQLAVEGAQRVLAEALS